MKQVGSKRRKWGEKGEDNEYEHGVEEEGYVGGVAGGEGRGEIGGGEE